MRPSRLSETRFRVHSNSVLAILATRTSLSSLRSSSALRASERAYLLLRKSSPRTVTNMLATA